MNDLINDRCLEALELTAEQLIVDVGAGTGQFTRRIAQRLRPDARVIAVERDPQQLQTALELARQAEVGNVDYRSGVATELPLTDAERGRVDLAHARFLLEHVSDPLVVVAEMLDALRPGGRVVLADDDHALMRFWPEPAGFAEAWRAYYGSYRHLGTDPLIGRRLVELLHTAGAVEVRTTQVFYGACAGSLEFAGIVENIAAVMEGARSTVVSAGLMSQADYDDATSELRRFVDVPGAAVWYAINWAEGRTP